MFAGLDVASGKVIGQCLPRHRNDEFLRFIKHLDKVAPTELDLHLIVDSYATHKHPNVRAWLEQHPRMHFTPTSASWLNLVERFFRDLTEDQIRRGVFRSGRFRVHEGDWSKLHEQLGPLPAGISGAAMQQGITTPNGVFWRTS